MRWHPESEELELTVEEALKQKPFVLQGGNEPCAEADYETGNGRCSGCDRHCFVWSGENSSGIAFNFKSDVSDNALKWPAEGVALQGMSVGAVFSWKPWDRIRAVLWLFKLGVRYSVWRMGKWVHAATGRRVE